MSNRVLVALSGGVDSSVCVKLLQEQKFDVGAVVFKMSPAHQSTVDAAVETANVLGIPIFIEDLTALFEQNVISYFINEYMNGKTPNPCVVCNKTVKFKALLDAANKYGYDFIATGHYAKLVKTEDEVFLKRGACDKRDQSYMLYRLSQDVLKRLLLPLSDMEKPSVREIALKSNMPAAKKPDSQEICFIPDNNYSNYIEKRNGKQVPGDFIAPDGKPCGKHKGIIHYTVGQRKGLGIALGEPVFVREIDPKTNNIYLSNNGGELFSYAIINSVTTVSDKPLSQSINALVKIRSTAALTPATITPLANNKAEVVFRTPQKAVAKGQSIVIYVDDCVIGGGFIE
ncbi:MAG: tRNA 2-thiouridine(34) synthase MnmA [Oscillospiraceae bacterium]